MTRLFFLSLLFSQRKSNLKCCCFALNSVLSVCCTFCVPTPDFWTHSYEGSKRGRFDNGGFPAKNHCSQIRLRSSSLGKKEKERKKLRNFYAEVRFRAEMQSRTNHNISPNRLRYILEMKMSSFYWVEFCKTSHAWNPFRCIFRVSEKK